MNYETSDSYNYNFNWIPEHCDMPGRHKKKCCKKFKKKHGAYCKKCPNQEA